MIACVAPGVGNKGEATLWKLQSKTAISRASARALLLANFCAAAADMAARGPRHENAIDQSWKALQPAHKWLVGAPPLGYQYGSFSDIEKRFCEYGC